MKLAVTTFWLLLIAGMACPGQAAKAQKPATLDDLYALWSNRNFETKDVLNFIDNVGIGFEMTEPNLTRLLEAAAKGNRPANEVAQVVFRLLRDCSACHAQLWGPRSEGDRFNLLKRGSSSAPQEVTMRGVKQARAGYSAAPKG